MAVVQSMQQWQNFQPMFAVDPSMSCGVQAGSLQMQPGQAMQQGVMMVPFMMVPVFVSSGPEPQQVASPSSCSSGGGSSCGLESESTCTPAVWSESASTSTSSRMHRIAERFALVASKPNGTARNEQVRQNVASLSSRGMHLSFPDLGFSVRSADEVRSFFIDFFNRMPDLQLTMLGISEDGPKHGTMEYLISGTQTEPFLPMFPVGKWVEWKFTSRYEFDRDSRIRVQETRFDFPSDFSSTLEQFEGLAQSLHMLASTAGGSRLLQKALDLDSVTDAGKTMLLEAMRGSVWEMSLSPHGNHVVQKCITSLFPQQVQFIVDAFKGRVAQAARSQMQSRILERILEYCPPRQSEQLVEEALSAASSLLTDAFGNFVIQATLEHGADRQRSRLVTIICRDVDRYSRDKISSNSVRRALMHSGPADQSALVAAIKADADRFASLSKHKIGSFVVRELKRVVRSLASP